MLLLRSPPLPPPVVPRLLRRASRWPPRAGPREQGPGRRAPSPPRRVPVQPPPAAGDAATSRLSISRGSAAKLPRLPPKVGAHLSGAGAGSCTGGSRAGARQRGADDPPRGASARAEAAAASWRRGAAGGRVADSYLGRDVLPPLIPRGPEDCLALGNWSSGRRGSLAAGGGPCGERGRAASLRLPAARALPSLASLRPVGRAGRPGYGSADSFQRWVFGVWPCWPGARKVSPLTSLETPPRRPHSAPGGLGGESRAAPRPQLREEGVGARRCTQPAASHLRVGYRYNPLLACLEAWALGSRTSPRILSRGLERKRIGTGGSCPDNHYFRLLEGR